MTFCGNILAFLDELDNLVDENVPFDNPPAVISPVQHLTAEVGETLNFQINPIILSDYWIPWQTLPLMSWSGS